MGPLSGTPDFKALYPKLFQGLGKAPMEYKIALKPGLKPFCLRSGSRNVQLMQQPAAAGAPPVARCPRCGYQACVAGRGCQARVWRRIALRLLVSADTAVARELREWTGELWNVV